MSETSRPGNESYDKLLGDLREAETIGSVAALLQWDQETMLPPRGTERRAEQIALLSGMVHERRTQPHIGAWLAECEADEDLLSDPEAAANVREIRRDYDRLTRLPGSLVREMAQTTTLALQAWREAREKSDFALFRPWLEKVVRLSRDKAECYGATTPDEMYDALLDEYEPGARAADLERVFSGLRARLVPLIGEIAGSGVEPDTRATRIRIPIAQQQAFNARVAERIGFDFQAGRLDVSTHPFCQGLGPGDTRLTTRYTEENFPEALSSTLHESGHGLYEQGLPKAEHPGQPLGEAVSLGIHESQSRLWENMVGRSRAFWEWAVPGLKESFGTPAADLTPEELFRAVNRVRPSLIRVEADEATYNLHIMLRFDLERALLRDDLPLDELPEAWNHRIREDLGLEVPDDRRGVLQDIHWSMGAIGYFPTYTLGNLYAGQLWEAIQREIPDVEERIARGKFAELLGWLRDRIHRHGRRYSAADLCEKVTGRPLEPEPFLRYLEGKLRPLYGI